MNLCTLAAALTLLAAPSAAEPCGGAGPARAAMANSDTPAAVVEMREVQARPALGLEVVTSEIRRPEDIAPAFEALMALGRSGRHAEASKMGRNADAFGFLLGEWDIAMLTMPEGSTVGRRATLNVHRVLDGAALLDEIRHVDEAGQINFRGATFRTYLLDRDRWYVVWMMANIDGCTELEAQVIDGEVHTTGKGKDPWGALVERGRYYDISGDGFSFTLDRSNDAGNTWIRPYVSFRANRRKPAA